MFLKQEKPEMDYFAEEKNLVLKEKYINSLNILRKYFEKLFLRIPLENVTNTFAYSFVSEHLSIFFLFWEKNLHFLAARGGGSTPPPLADVSAKNARFFYVLP